ncbi:hypothetical protein F4808DRAFT_471749 [Astrocystis sublimbata]|nr:hypothetical protein F4808DRAFT_471749 [Astrocystis sublimbata]
MPQDSPTKIPDESPSSRKRRSTSNSEITEPEFKKKWREICPDHDQCPCQPQSGPHSTTSAEPAYEPHGATQSSRTSSSEWWDAGPQDMEGAATARAFLRPDGVFPPPVPLTGYNLMSIDRGSLNSVRPPDVFIPCNFDFQPWDIGIQPILFEPRALVELPAHILELEFNLVIRRYKRFARLIDDYQRWHGRSVFGFWTDDEIALAEAGDDPVLTKAYHESRPAITPRILSARFDEVLQPTPLLSHLIERYQNDLGLPKPTSIGPCMIYRIQK